MKDFEYYDALFEDFIQNSNDNSWEELVNITNEWLFDLIICFTFDGKKAENILDSVYKKSLIFAYQGRYDLAKRGILYELFLITKGELKLLL